MWMHAMESQRCPLRCQPRTLGLFGAEYHQRSLESLGLSQIIVALRLTPLPATSASETGEEEPLVK